MYVMYIWAGIFDITSQTFTRSPGKFIPDTDSAAAVSGRGGTFSYEMQIVLVQCSSF